MPHARHRGAFHAQRVRPEICKSLARMGRSALSGKATSNFQIAFMSWKFGVSQGIREGKAKILCRCRNLTHIEFMSQIST